MLLSEGGGRQLPMNDMGYGAHDHDETVRSMIAWKRACTHAVVATWGTCESKSGTESLVSTSLLWSNTFTSNLIVLTQSPP